MNEQSHFLESARRELAHELLRDRNRQNPVAVLLAVLVLAFAPVVQLSFAAASAVGPGDSATKIARMQNVAITEEWREDFLSAHDVICARGFPKESMNEFYRNQFATIGPAVLVGATLFLTLTPDSRITNETIGKVFYRSLPFRPDFPFGHCLDYSILS